MAYLYSVAQFVFSNSFSLKIAADHMILFVKQYGKVRFFSTALPGELLLHQNMSCEGYGLMLKVGIAWNPPEKTDALRRLLLREFKSIGSLC